jgi:GxxExxY protein
MLTDNVSERILGCAFKVANTLGPGFLEKVYENALAHELRKAGLEVQPQVKIDIWYDGVLVGEFLADLLVEGRILVELKACRALTDAHSGQALNYLAATSLKTCLLLNFGTAKIQVRRISRDRPPTPA